MSDLEFRAVGLLEVLGALGLVLPGALGIAPLVTPLAAVGLALIMVGAIATHVRIGDNFIPPLVLGVMLWAGLWLREPRLRAVFPLNKGETR